MSENFNPPDGLLISPLWVSAKKMANNEVVELSSPTCYAAELINPSDELSLSNSEPADDDSSLSPTNLYAWEATVNGAASAINFIEQESGLRITPEQINRSLMLQPNHNCYFLNAFGGLGAPYWRTDLQSRFSAELSGEEKILAWLESIIFQIVINVKLMNQLSDAQKIYISGGISKSNVICQKLADLLNVAVHRSENTDATLQGIAYMAGGFPSAWNCNLNDDIFLPQSNPALHKTFNQWQESMTHWLSV